MTTTHVTIHARRLTSGYVQNDGGRRNRVVPPEATYPKRIDPHDKAVIASSETCRSGVALVAAMPRRTNCPGAFKSIFGKKLYKAAAGSETTSTNAHDNPDILSAYLKFVRRNSLRKIKNEIARYPRPRMTHSAWDICRW